MEDEVKAVVEPNGFVMWIPPVHIYVTCHEGHDDDAETKCTLKSVLYYVTNEKKLSSLGLRPILVNSTHTTKTAKNQKCY